MSFIEVVKREGRRIAQNPFVWIIMVIVPLVMSLVICETFKSGSPKNLPIAVLDKDNSTLSRQLVRMIQATPTCNVDYYVEDLNEGKNLIIEGDVYALVVIPRDFKRDLYRNSRPKIVFYYNNQMILIGGSISKDVTMAVRTFMNGIDVNLRSKRGVSTDVAMKQVNLVAVDEHIMSNPYLNYSYFLALGSFSHILQILILFVAVWAFGSEFKYGTSKEWLNAADNSIITATFAKLFPYFAIFLAVIMIIYAVYFGVYQAPFAGSFPFVFFATLIFIFAYQILGVMFVAITVNLRLSLSCGAFFTAMGFAFAGITFPIMAMPNFAKFYSWLMPLRHYMSILIDQVLRGIPPKYDLHSIFAMLVLCCVGLAFVPRLKTVAMDESQWYKL